MTDVGSVTGAADEPSATITLGRRHIRGRTLCAGEAAGQVLALSRPLSFWGGVDHQGRIIDAHHPQAGASIVGVVLAMSGGRGSSSSSSVLAELIRLRTAPAAVVLTGADAIIALGALAAAELYAVYCPVVQISPADLTALPTGVEATVVAP